MTMGRLVLLARPARPEAERRHTFRPLPEALEA